MQNTSLRLFLLLVSAIPALAYRDLETGEFISRDPVGPELMMGEDYYIVNGRKIEARPSTSEDAMEMAAMMNNHRRQESPTESARKQTESQYGEVLRAQYGGSSQSGFVSVMHVATPGEANLYRYVVNNPWTKFDPLGLYPVENNGAGAAYIHMYNGNISKPGETGSFVFNPNPNWSRQCATGAQFLAGSTVNGNTHDVPSTASWQKGAAVDGNKDLKPGTVVAKGWDSKGGYINKSETENAGNHTGIYVGQDKNNIYVYDQFNGESGAYKVRGWPKQGSDWSVVTTPGKTDPKPSKSYVGEKGQKKPKE